MKYPSLFFSGIGMIATGSIEEEQIRSLGSLSQSHYELDQKLLSHFNSIKDKVPCPTFYMNSTQ